MDGSRATYPPSPRERRILYVIDYELHELLRRSKQFLAVAGASEQTVVCLISRQNYLRMQPPLRGNYHASAGKKSRPDLSAIRSPRSAGTLMPERTLGGGRFDRCKNPGSTPRVSVLHVFQHTKKKPDQNDAVGEKRIT